MRLQGRFIAALSIIGIACLCSSVTAADEVPFSIDAAAVLANAPQLSLGVRPLETLEEEDQVNNAGASSEEDHRQLSVLTAATKTWNSKYGDGVWVIPFEIQSTLEPHAVKKIQWVLEYLAWGGNFEFVQVTDRKQPFIFFLDGGKTKSVLSYSSGICSVDEGSGSSTNRGCAIVIGEADCLPQNCPKRASILQAMVIRLGFSAEQTHPEAGKYVKFSALAPASFNNTNAPLPANSKVTGTYDMASKAHYSGAYMNAVDSYNSRPIRTMFPVLSSCDWNALNSLYAGPKKAPVCYPHELPEVYGPTEHCFELFSYATCMTMCREEGGDWDLGLPNAICGFEEGLKFPRDAMYRLMYHGDGSSSS